MDHREKKIGSASFRVMMLDPESAEDCIFDILKMLGPTLAGLVQKLQGTGVKGLQALLEKKTESSEFGELATSVLRDFSQGFDKATYHEVSRRLMSVTHVSVKGGPHTPLKDVAAELFRGNLQQKWQWLGFALEVNFAGFFAAFSSAAGPALAAVAKGGSTSSSQPASDGASGG